MIRYYDSTRLIALTDGIFAVALTILIFELKFPDPPPNEMVLVELVKEDWHPFLGWLVSLVILIRLWLIHHDTLSDVVRVSSRTIGANLVFLGTIVLIPFSTHLISIYDFRNPFSLQVFAVLIGISCISLGWLVHSVHKDQVNVARVNQQWSPRALHHLLVVPVISLVAVLAIQVDPVFAAVVWGVESVIVIVVLFTSGRSVDPDDLDGLDDKVTNGY